MARARKTVEIKILKDEANRRMAIEGMSDETISGIFCFMSSILHDTGNYHGFNFVEWAKEGGCERWIADGSPEDNTPYLGNQKRRFFY